MPRRRMKKEVPLPLTAQEIYRNSLLSSGKLDGMCKRTPPCGGICALDPDVPHIYHGCADPYCGFCHGYKRFQAKESR